MAITKILNIMESEGRSPASHLKNALEYIQNPDKTEECVLVGGINCLPDTAFEQMEETKNIFHKTGKRQGYHVIISFSPEEKVTSEQAMYVLEHFAKDVLGDDYEAVYAVHTDREHMHGHLIWNSVSMTTGKKYNSPKGNWKNHLQPITNKYCDELGLSIMPAEYSRNSKNISRDKWEKEMSMKEIILRDAKMCAYAAGNVEHFKYLMKRLGYVFKKDAWMEVQAPGFRYYHKLAKMDEMFSEDMLRHYVDMPWMSKPYFYSSDIRGLHRAKLSPYQKRFYSKLYRLRIVEQKRFIVGGAKYTEDLKRFHRLQDEYLLLVNNDIKSVVDLVDFISEQEEKIQQIEDRQHEIYRESSSRKRNIKTEAQYRKYQIWHVEVQEKLDELKQEKRKIKRQLQLADDIIKEDLYTAYYAVSGKEEIVADRDVEIPGMEEDMLVERTAGAVVESERNVVVMNQPANNHNDGNGQKEQINVAGKQQIDLEGTEMSKVHNLSDENVTRMDEGITDVTGKSELVEHEEKESVDEVGWIVRRISDLGGFENVSDSVKADVFGFDIADISGSIRLFYIKIVSDDLTKLDGSPAFLLMKQAISTGWDCPRAKILVKLREGGSEDFQIQTIGRIRRMPEGKHYGLNILDYCYIYTLDTQYKMGLLSALDKAYQVRRLFLRDEAKDFTLTKEMRDLDFDGLGERETLEKVYAYFKEKYHLGSDKKVNQENLEAGGYNFSHEIDNKILQGIYRVENVDRYDDRLQVTTNLIEAYDLLMEFVAKHTSDKFCLIDNVNTSIRGIIAREVIGNILVHRDYSSAFPAKVIIEKDWLKTENWCIPRRHGNIMSDEFTPYPKNPLIQQFFANIGRTDTIGSGVRNLYKYTPIYSDGGKPELIEDDVFRITIPLDKMAADEAREQKILSEREQKIYNMICENLHLSVEQVMAELDISRATVFRDYAKIKKVTGAMYDKKTSTWTL